MSKIRAPKRDIFQIHKHTQKVLKEVINNGPVLQDFLKKFFRQKEKKNTGMSLSADVN